MNIFNYLKPLSIGIIIIASPAHADLSGLGGAVGNVTDSVTSSSSSPSASASAATTATVSGVAEVGLCAEVSVNSEGGNGCGSSQAALATPVLKPEKALTSGMIVGLPVMGSGDELVGHVKQVALDGKQIEWILVETPSKRKVQLTNAIKSIGLDGIRLGLSQSLINSRLKGSFTRLRVECPGRQQKQQHVTNLNSCWDGA